MRGRQSILIVDDEAILLLSMRQELKLKFGNKYLYETALNAEQGFRTIDKLRDEGSPVMLVISDLLMPGMRGDDFLRRLRVDNPDLRLALLSGHADNVKMINLAAELNLIGFLPKPYRSYDLFSLVEKASKTK